MKPFSRFFTDLGLFLIFFGVAGGVLYTGVYSEETVYPDSGKVLISEVRPNGGSGKSNDEFIEIYNPSTQPVIISGWSIYRMTKSASSTDRQLLFTFPVGTILPSHSHALVAHFDFTGETSSDFRYTGQALADDNTVVLVNEAGEVVDLVGYGLAKNTEISPAEAPTTQLLSIERRPGGLLGNGQDTNNNQVDFFRVQSNPQNLNSPSAPALVVSNNESEIVSSTEGVFLPVPEEVLEENHEEPEVAESEVVSTSTTTLEIITPTSTVLGIETTTSTTDLPSPTSTVAILNNPAPTPTSTTVFVPTYLPGDILINELYPIPESGQNEFVELFNVTAQTIDLVGWYLTEGSNAKTLLTGALSSKNYLVIEKPKGSLNNSGDVISLFAPNNIVIDRVTYGDWNDDDLSNNAGSAEAGMSLGRVKESQDTGQDGVDFGLSTTVTKGSVNIYSPVVNEVDVAEAEDEPVITVTNNVSTVTATPKTTSKSGPLYPRIIYSTKGKVGSTLTFDASQSSGGQGTRKYIWEMDDGTILRGEIITHVFTEPGNYSVSLTLADDTSTEKHKTVRVGIEENELETAALEKTKVQTATAKTVVAKKTNETVFVSLSDMGSLKTNTQIRVRGVLAGILATKTNPEFYVVAETSAGGSAAGILIKTKSTTLDARIGDVVEITGKYIVNSTGNYVQFSNTDQLSIVGNGEIVTPMSSTIKEVKQMAGGYVQISGEVIEKKTNYIFVGDITGEIKVNNSSSDSLKADDTVIITGYIIKTKDGSEVKLAGPDGIQIKKAVITPGPIKDQAPPAKAINIFIVLGIVFVGLIGWGVKKFWFERKNEIIPETEI